MTTKLDEIERALAAATPGPWKTVDLGISKFPTGTRPDFPSTEADAEFIALARNSMPALLAELKRLARVEAAAKAWLRSDDRKHKWKDSYFVDTAREKLREALGEKEGT